MERADLMLDKDIEALANVMLAKVKLPGWLFLTPPAHPARFFMCSQWEMEIGNDHTMPRA